MRSFHPHSLRRWKPSDRLRCRNRSEFTPEETDRLRFFPRDPLLSLPFSFRRSRPRDRLRCRNGPSLLRPFIWDILLRVRSVFFFPAYSVRFVFVSIDPILCWRRPVRSPRPDGTRAPVTSIGGDLKGLTHSYHRCSVRPLVLPSILGGYIYPWSQKGAFALK